MYYTEQQWSEHIQLQQVLHSDTENLNKATASTENIHTVMAGDVEDKGTIHKSTLSTFQIFS